MPERNNHRLNEEIERQIAAWEGTIHSYQIKNAYENGSSYEAVCELAGINYEDYEEC